MRKVPNNVKSPSFAYFGERTPRRYYIFSLSRFLDRFALLTGLVTKFESKIKGQFLLAVVHGVTVVSEGHDGNGNGNENVTKQKG